MGLPLGSDLDGSLWYRVEGEVEGDAVGGPEIGEEAETPFCRREITKAGSKAEAAGWTRGDIMIGLDVENGEEVWMTSGLWIWVTSAVHQERRRVLEALLGPTHCHLQTLDLKVGQREK